MARKEELRDYDRLLKFAGEQMVAVSPRPDLVRVAADADVPLERACEMFADDDALAAMVLQQQMVLLTDAVTRGATAAPAQDVVARIRAMTHAYLDWFFDNPGAGRLLISPPAMASAAEADVRRFSTGIYDLVQSMMQGAREDGLIRADVDIPGFLLTVRTLTVGSVLLQDMDHARLWGGLDDPRQALRGIVDNYFALATALPPAGSTA